MGTIEKVALHLVEGSLTISEVSIIFFRIHRPFLQNQSLYLD
jgi:hypothetical protein